MSLVKLFTSIFARSVDSQKSTSRWQDKLKRPEFKSESRFVPLKGHRFDIPEVMEFQSKMEANVYRFYKWRGVKVEYEPQLFRFPVSTYPYVYIPDLRISDGHKPYFIEIKGKMTQEAIFKARRMRIYYPDILLYFLTPDKYEIIKKHYARFIPNWEW